MARTEELSASGTLAADTWRSVLDLLGLPQTAEVYVREGFLNVQTNGGTFVLVPKGGQAPSGSSGVGVARAAGSISTFGPTSGTYRGYPLHRLWVRNTSAGANATLAFEGVVEVP